jgi:hypothetical protein
MLLELDLRNIDIDSEDQFGPLHQTNKVKKIVKLFN